MLAQLLNCMSFIQSHKMLCCVYSNIINSSYFLLSVSNGLTVLSLLIILHVLLSCLCKLLERDNFHTLETELSEKTMQKSLLTSLQPYVPLSLSQTHPTSFDIHSPATHLANLIFNPHSNFSQVPLTLEHTLLYSVTMTFI